MEGSEEGLRVSAAATPVLVPPPSAAAEAGFLEFPANLIASLIQSEGESRPCWSDSANGDPCGLTDPALLRLMRGDATLGGPPTMPPLIVTLPEPACKGASGSEVDSSGMEQSTIITHVCVCMESELKSYSQP